MTAIMTKPIGFLTIHCAATPEGRDVAPETVESWDIARFGQKSYHWIVPLSGAAHRSLSDKIRGAHVGLHNDGNIGLCYVGGTDRHGNPEDTRTEAQRSALRKLVEDYCALYPGIVVRGHRDWPNVHKACPSFDVKAWLESFGMGEHFG